MDASVEPGWTDTKRVPAPTPPKTMLFQTLEPKIGKLRAPLYRREHDNLSRRRLRR
jgi:hypothetical protein